MGSLLGILVVIGTVGLLAFGIVTFLQRPPAPVATAPPVAVASPTAEASAPGTVNPTDSGLATPIGATLPPPSGEPTPAGSAAITPPPTPFAPAVNIGPGYVTFGTESNSQLHVTDPKTVFGTDERMVWSAFLTASANSSDLRIEIYKLDPSSPDGQRLVAQSDVRPVANDVQRFLRRVRVATLIDGPGLYTVRYLRGTEIMSEGSFLVQE